MSTPRLQGKVAIITGAASGIGEATARLFASNGAIVVIADIQDELGLRVAASIGPTEKCVYRHCNVTDETQVAATVDFALQTFGRLDIVYANAGISGRADLGILNLDKRDFESVVAVNVVGPALAIKHGGGAMAERGVRGSILCTSSVAGRQAAFGPAAYTVSKHALSGLVRAAAAELGRYGIRVNSVSPYILPSGITGENGLSADVVEDVCRSTSILKGTTLKASHVAEAALFLASDESAFISGHDLVVDGATTVTYTGISSVMEGVALRQSAIEEAKIVH